MSKYVVYILIFSYLGGFCQSRSLTKVELNDSINFPFSIIIGGHLYGESYNGSGLPSSVFYAFLPKLNEHDLFLSTGDIFLDVKNDYDRYKAGVFNQVKIPWYNAVGNHDVSGDFYGEKMGSTYFSLTIGRHKIIILDTELNDSSIKDEQLEFFKSEINGSLDLAGILIFSHRPIWAEENDEIGYFFKHNTRSKLGLNFNSEVFPLLEKIDPNIALYWFSGSMDNGPAPFFYYPLENRKGAFIQTAIRDRKMDGFLNVVLDSNNVEIQTVDPFGNKMEAIEFYGVSFWKKHFGEAPHFNWRLVPYEILKRITSDAFYFGILFGIFLYWIGSMGFKYRSKE